MDLPHHEARPLIIGTPGTPKMYLFLCVSCGLHLLALLVGFGLRGRGLIGGHGIPEGSGFGGTSIAFEIQGDPGLAPQGAINHQDAVTPDETPPPAPPASERSEEAATTIMHAEERAPDGVVETDEAAVPTPEAAPPAPEPPPRRRAERPAPEIAGADNATPGGADAPIGTGGEDSTAGPPAGDASGLILDSAGLGGNAITAQRALLPDGGRCEDPVAGVWHAQKYRPEGYRGTWVRFSLRVRRQGEQLSGTITSRIWRGNPSNPRPVECTAFGFDHTWQMDAVGAVEGTHMTFGSVRARLLRQDCPSSDSRYAPDHFDGVLDPMRDTFQSRNNDGAFDIDEPYTFRRVSCE